MKKLFITGAGGFIGKALIKKLSKKYYIISLLRNTKEIDTIKKLGAKEVVIGDIQHPKKFTTKLNSCQTLIHLAALRSNWMPKKEFFDINSNSLKALLNECKKNKHVIVTSSTYVHGFENTINIDENSPFNAKDLYGKSKIKAEEVTKESLFKRNIPYTIMRPTIVYGPGDNQNGMIIKLIKLIKSGRFFVLGGGKNKVQLIYIDDLADAYAKAVENSVGNKTYILAGDEKIEMKKLAQLIQKELKVHYKIPSIPKLPLLYLSYLFELIFKIGLLLAPNTFSKEPPLLPAKVRVLGNNWTYNNNLSKKDLGVKAKTTLKKGIVETIKFSS